MSSNVFTPDDVTINVGEIVTWMNAEGEHNVSFDDGSFTQPASASDDLWTVSRPFGAAGVFRYYCVLHGGPGGNGMAGIVRVNVPAPGPAPPPGAPPPSGNPPGGTAPGEPEGPGAPGQPGAKLTPFKVTLKLSDATPRAGSRVRFSGSVRPARDGRSVLIQRRARGGRYKTVARTRLRDAESATHVAADAARGRGKSAYALRLRVSRDGVYRARVAGDGDNAAGTSRTRRVDVS